ncbi:hypothetical protein [Oryza sativa Japonica Group]|uniref:Uncharacterized protein n=1 Tax=Oryza sativa subsp. japonica TaxID=39947 RepID=Q5N7V4_ORYSJ|nr:hypothetical protein [Oryza sativa Japonica Group]BAD82477.1 hypothetical protein [Oryza sativa Japonica Group]
MRGGRRVWRRGLPALTAKLKAVGAAVALDSAEAGQHASARHAKRRRQERVSRGGHRREGR